MPEILAIFFLTAGISFAGSVQLGPVNTALIQTTLQKSVRSGLWVAFGGCLPEIIYASLALGGNELLSQNQHFIHWLKIAVVPALLLIGLFTIWQQYKKGTETTTSRLTHQNPFISGFTLGLFNPQLLPFWLAVLVYINSIYLVNSPLRQAAFVAGTSAGAFFVLSLIVWATHHFRERLTQFFNRFPIGYIVGLIFVSLAILQGIRLL